MRQISLAPGERNWQLPGRVDVTEKNVGNGFAASLTGIPGFQDGLYAVQPGHQNGVSVFQHDDGMGIRRRNLLDQFVLIVRQRKTGQVGVFVRVLMDEHNRDVRTAGQFGGGCGIRPIVIVDLGVWGFGADCLAGVKKGPIPSLRGSR